MTLDIENKEDHPLATAQMNQYGEKFFLKASEVNKIVAAIKSLQETEVSMQWASENW